MENLKNRIAELADFYASNLRVKIEERKVLMKSDENSHYLIYRVLGITTEEGELIDSYQNTGRFLYNYAGSFLEHAATLCLNYKFSDGIKTKVKNTLGQRPKTFEID
jgi:ApaLI-like restriction endonuclease